MKHRCFDKRNVLFLNVLNSELHIHSSTFLQVLTPKILEFAKILQKSFCLRNNVLFGFLLIFPMSYFFELVNRIQSSGLNPENTVNQEISLQRLRMFTLALFLSRRCDLSSHCGQTGPINWYNTLHCLFNTLKVISFIPFASHKMVVKTLLAD